MAGFALIALAAFFVQPTYPSYDGYYSLVWAREIIDGSLPGFEVPAAPTEHPLALVLGLLSLPFGEYADRVYVFFSVMAFVGLVAAVYIAGARAFSRPVGLFAAGIVATRSDLIALASRGFIDIPFLALVLWAVAEEISYPRRGYRVYVLLAFAGLFRPEAWLFAGIYWLYRWPVEDRVHRIRQALLVGAPAIIWFSLDFLVTGNPLYSLTATRELAGELGRNASFIDVVLDTPTLLAKTVKLSVLLAGVAGIAYALVAFPRRAVWPLAVAAVGMGTFLITSALGLSINIRYLSVPSVMICLAAAVAVAGWTIAPARLRTAGLVVAVLAGGLMVARIPTYERDFSRLFNTMGFVERQHDTLGDLLEGEAPELALESCGFITVPSHQNVPIARQMLSAGGDQVRSSTFQARPPEDGLLLIAIDPRFKVKPGPIGRSNWWSNTKLRGFEPLGRNKSWLLLHAGCANRS